MNQETLMVGASASSTYGSMPEEPSAARDSLGSKTNQRQQQQSERWSFAVGILYVVIIVCGITSEVVLRGNAIDYNEVDMTMARIQATPAALRWSLLLDLIMSLSDVALSILLGAVLIVNGASKLWTVMAMVFRIVQQAVLAANLLHLLVASLLLDPTLASWQVLSRIWDEAQAESLAMLFLYVHKYGYAIALVFFAVSMALLGGVIWKSRVYPQWLGVAISLAGLGYFLDSISYFAVEAYTGDGTMNNIYMLPVFVAEFGFAGWLLFCKPTPAP